MLQQTLQNLRLRVARRLAKIPGEPDATDRRDLDERSASLVSATLVAARLRQLRPSADLAAIDAQPDPRLDLDGLASTVADTWNRPDVDLLGVWHQLRRAQRLAVRDGALTLAARDGARRTDGTYFTPFPVIDAMLDGALAWEAADPPPTVVDPAMGTGAFLLAAFDRLFDRFSTERPADDAALAALEHLHGVDLDEEAVELARWNLLLRALAAAPSLPVDQARDRVEHRLRHGDALLSADPPGQPRSDADQTTRSDLDRRLAETHDLALDDRQPLHWNRAFPDILHENDGFDLVVGNPPWVSYGLRDAGSLPEAEKNYLRDRFARSAQYKLPLYPIFMELGLQLTRPGGVSSLIVPDSFLGGSQFSKVRRLLLEEDALEAVTLLGEGIWGEATSGRSVIYRARRGGAGPTATIREVESAEDLTDATGRDVPLERFRGTDGSRLEVIFDAGDDQLIEQMRRSELQVGDLLDFYSGAIARYGQDSVRADAPRDRWVIRDRDGEPVIDDEEARDRWRPLVDSGRHIAHYAIDAPDRFIYVQEDPDRRRAYAKSGFNPDRYRGPKLFVRQTGDRLVAARDDEGRWCLNNLHVANPRTDATDLSYVLALLNSRALNAFYQLITMERGRTLAQTDIETLRRLPVPDADPTRHQAIAELADRLTNTDPASDRHAELRTDLDSRICDLYAVDPDRVAAAGA